MIEVTLDKVANDFLFGGFYPDGSKHGIKIKYKDWFKTFSAFCDFVAVEGWNNKTGKFICNLGNYIQYIFEKYYVIDYKPCHLTQCEMAIWDCLLNIL